jgi:endo-1,4-beta-xylanase
MNKLLRLLTLCSLLLPPAASAADLTLADAARVVGLHVGAAIDHHLSEERWQVAAREFTSATVENSLKWWAVSPAPGVYDFTRADRAVELAEERGLRVRGHTLFWDRLNGKPAWLAGEVAAAPDPAARLMELMETHAATVVGRYAGRLAHWDVVNEPLKLLGGNLDPANFYYQTLGEEYIDLALHAAHAADPEALLFVNEALTETLAAKFDGLIALVERLLARGAPLHGVGLQGHYALSRPDRIALQAQLERIAALGLVVELTEVDIVLSLFASEPDPLAAQADAYADLFEACLAVPACTGITTWGIDDGDTWLDSFFLTAPNAPNRPLLFDALLRPKPAYDAVLEALRARIAEVAIDVKPGSSRNPIHPRSRGVVPVALLGSDTFDVLDVDPATLVFGPRRTGIAHRRGPALEDVDDDGLLDLIGHFRVRRTGIAPGDEEACLSGRNLDGEAFRGCDAIQTRRGRARRLWR